MTVIHPKERDRLASDAVSTLVVTVKSGDEFHEDVATALERLERGESVDGTPTLSFESYDRLLAMFTPTTLELLDTVRREQPASINDAARVVERDVSNVHNELTRLANMGVIYFVEEGRSKRPVVWFDDLVIDIPVGERDEETVPA
jgi:predicted transcriptional regulator